jgi:cellulose biosynthesis protein BcsQ
VRGAVPRAMREVMTELRKKRAANVFQEVLSEATDVAESVDAHQPIFLYKKNAKTARQILAITQEFVNRT